LFIDPILRQLGELVAYADDVNLIMKEEEIKVQLQNAIKLFKVVGLNVSPEKTEIWKASSGKSLTILNMMVAGKVEDRKKHILEATKTILESAQRRATLNYVERRQYANEVVAGKLGYKIFGAAPIKKVVILQVEKQIRAWVLKDYPRNFNLEYYYIKMPGGFGLRSVWQAYENLCLNFVLKIVKGKVGTISMKAKFQKWWSMLQGQPVMDWGIRSVEMHIWMWLIMLFSMKNWLPHIIKSKLKIHKILSCIGH